MAEGKVRTVASGQLFEALKALSPSDLGSKPAEQRNPAQWYRDVMRMEKIMAGYGRLPTHLRVMQGTPRDGSIRFAAAHGEQTQWELRRDGGLYHVGPLATQFVSRIESGLAHVMIAAFFGAAELGTQLLLPMQHSATTFPPGLLKSATTFLACRLHKRAGRCSRDEQWYHWTLEAHLPEVPPKTAKTAQATARR